MTVRYDAVVLAGGRARRLSGTDKPAALVGGRRLLDVVLEAVDGAAATVVVGPDRQLPAGVLHTREDPPYGGPAPAVAAGLAALDAARTAAPPALVAVLAGDLPDLTAGAVETLLSHAESSTAPVVLAADESGRPQYLLSVWRTEVLRAALQRRDGAAIAPLIPPGAAVLLLTGTADVDTEDELTQARRRHRPGRLDPGAARRRLAAALDPVPSSDALLAGALGAALAESLCAATDFPPFDASAMDGYAVAGDGPWALVDAPRAAGHLHSPPLAPGTAAVIATGAALPGGADRVIRHEEIAVDGELLRETGSGRDDTRRRGSAWTAGTELAPAGTVVDATVVSVARSAGVAAAAVRGPLQAVLYTSGDEITADATTEPGPGQVPDTASGPVAALLTELGVRVRHGGHLTDTAADFADALGQVPDATAGPAAETPDLIVVIGATGHGIADRLRTALDTADAELIVDGITMRPGGSLLAARLPDGTAIIGLGGNPLAAVAGAALIAPTVVAARTGAAPRAAESIDVAGVENLTLPNRWRVLPVEPDGHGRWQATAGRGTGHLASAVGFRGLALIPPAGSDAAVERLR